MPDANFGRTETDFLNFKPNIKMKAYKVIYNHSAPSIEEVEIQEFGVYYVILDGKRQSNKTQFYAWFKTKEEAMECLLNYAKTCVIRAEQDLEIAKKYFFKVENTLQA